MALSVVDLYAKVLPRTNCGDCGYPTCLAFAGMVVSQKMSLSGCPHLSAEIKLAFDETITEHLDIESILFLSEHLAGRLIASDR